MRRPRVYGLFEVSPSSALRLVGSRPVVPQLGRDSRPGPEKEPDPGREAKEVSSVTSVDPRVKHPPSLQKKRINLPRPLECSKGTTVLVPSVPRNHLIRFVWVEVLRRGSEVGTPTPEVH